MARKKSSHARDKAPTPSPWAWIVGCSSFAAVTAACAAAGVFGAGFHTALRQQELRTEVDFKRPAAEVFPRLVRYQTDAEDASLRVLGDYFAAIQAVDFDKAKQVLDDAPDFPARDKEHLERLTHGVIDAASAVDQTKSAAAEAERERQVHFRRFEQVRESFSSLMRQGSQDAPEGEMKFYADGLLAHLPVLKDIPDGLGDMGMVASFLPTAISESGERVKTMTKEEFEAQLKAIRTESASVEDNLLDIIEPRIEKARAAVKKSEAALAAAQEKLAESIKTLTFNALAADSRQGSVRLYRFVEREAAKHGIELPPLATRS